MTMVTSVGRASTSMAIISNERVVETIRLEVRHAPVVSCLEEIRLQLQRLAGQLVDLAGVARLAGGDDPDGPHHLVRAGVLEQEPAGPGAERVDNVVVEVEAGDDQDPRRCGRGGAGPRSWGVRTGRAGVVLGCVR